MWIPSEWLGDKIREVKPVIGLELNFERNNIWSREENIVTGGAEQRPGQEPRQSAGLEQRQTDGQEKIRKAGQEQRQSAELESK